MNGRTKMRVNTFRQCFMFSDITMSLFVLSFVAILQGGMKPGVVVGAPTPDKHFKNSAFNELRSRQRISKRRIRNDYSKLKSSINYDDHQSMHGCEVDEFWNSTQDACSQCTRCTQNKGKTAESWTLRGCGLDRDTECGTIGELQKQLSKKQRGTKYKVNTRSIRKKNKHGKKHKLSSDEEEKVVYGYVAPRPPSTDYSDTFGHQDKHGNGHRRKQDSHKEIKEKMHNWSQGREEFLKQIHEEDNIGLGTYGNYADDIDSSANYGQINYDYDYEPEEYQEYSDPDQEVSVIREDSSLHQEIARIKNQLDNEPEEDASNIITTAPFHIISNPNNYGQEKINKLPTTTEKYIFAKNWDTTLDGGNSYRKYYYDKSYDTATKQPTGWKETNFNITTSKVYTAHTLNVPDFIDSGDKDNHINSEYGFVYKDEDITTEMGVFGAVVKQSPKFGDIAETLLEPVDLIGRILHKNNSTTLKNGHSSKNNEDKADQGLRLEHGLVVVGFVIGFGFVFAVGLLYAKVQRVRRFKLLDNTNAGRTNVNTNLNEGGNGSFNEEATCESSLISTRNSSIDSQVQTQQIGNFQMKPKPSPNSSLTSPIGVRSAYLQESEHPREVQNGQSLFAKATLIKPKTAAEVAAKTSSPIVSQLQQQILSPVSTIASETSQSQMKHKSISPNSQSILLTAQEGIGDVLRNVGSSSIISSSSSLFGGSSNTHSPVSGTPIQLSNCITSQPLSSPPQHNNGGQLQHSTYVDQRGRSTLIKPATPARELPV